MKYINGISSLDCLGVMNTTQNSNDDSTHQILSSQPSLAQSLTSHACWRAKYGQSLTKNLTSSKECLEQIVSHPQTYCVNQRLIKFILFCIGTVHLYTAVLCIDTLQRDGFTYLNLNSFKLSSISAPFDLESVVLQNIGCKKSKVLSVNQNMSWTFSNTMNVDGFILHFRDEADCKNQSFFFTLEAQREGDQFLLIGAASMRWTAAGVRFVNRSAPGCTSRMYFDFRPPWSWYFSAESVLYNFVLGTGFIGSCICTFFETPEVSTRMIVFVLCLASLVSLISVFGYLSEGFLQESFLPCWEFLTWMMLSVGLFKAAWATIELLMLFGILFLVGRVVNDVALHQDPLYLTHRPGQPVACFVVFLAGCLFWCRRSLFRSRAIAGIAPYRDRFEEAWSQVQSTESDALQELQAQAAMIRVSGGNVRHLCRLLDLDLEGESPSHPGNLSRNSAELASQLALESGLSPPHIRFEVPKTIPGSFGAPVASLDQLYSQSLFLAPILASACLEWADMCNGSVDLCWPDAAITNDQDGLMPELRAWVRTGMVKSPRRAARKATACYGGDPSRVLDVCRGRILFATVGGMVRCLQLIRSQASRVVVRRLRSGMSSGHNASQTAGFRTVSLCVCFDNEITRRLGLENHVCEVQLLHELFARVLKSVDIDQYHAFREARPARVDTDTTRNFAYGRRLFARSVQVLPTSGWQDDVSESTGDRLGVDVAPQPRIADAISFQLDATEIGSTMPEGVSAVIKSDLMAVAHNIYQRYALGFCGALDRHVWNFEAAMHMASSSSVLFSVRPINAFATTLMGRAFYTLLVVLLVALIAAAWWLESGVNIGHVKDVYRVQSWNVNGSSRISVEGPVRFFGDECGIDSMKSNHEYQPSFTQNTGHPLNGYDVAVHPDLSMASNVSQSVSWSLERSSDNGTSWEPVGLCSWVMISIKSSEGYSLGWRGTVWAHIDCQNGKLIAHSLPGSLLRVDFRPDAAFFWLSFGNYWIPAGLGCVVLAAVLKRASAVKYIMMLATGGYGVFCVFWGLYALAIGHGWRRAVFLWTGFYALPMIWFPAGVVLMLERNFVFMISSTGFLLAADVLILWFVIYQARLIINLRTFINSLTGLYLMFIGAVWYFLSQRQLRYAAKLVFQDSQLYDQIWQGILDKQYRDCMTLKQQVASLQQMSTASIGYQNSLNMKVAKTGFPQKRNCFQNIWRQENFRPVRQGTNCLDHLFVQALCLQPLLFEKLRLWSGSQGLYHTNSHSGSEGQLFQPFSEVLGGIYDDMEQRSRLKSAHRAIEKVIRSYGHDASRLCDVCRQTAVFADLSAMTECLSAISCDPEAHIVRIKNRLDPDYDAGTSAGYRDININLRITSQAAVTLGVDSHICEIQLVLLPIAQLKSERGHRYYIICRNLRAD